MAYQTYITEALICGSYDSNTADRSYRMFTREAGMLYAHARSVREERSKHRYALQDFSHIRVTLVRGKSGWKIVGTESIRNLYAETNTREERAFLKKVIQLLSRVAHGETPHQVIFDDVVALCSEIGMYSLQKSETLLSLKILYILGYIDLESKKEDIIDIPIHDVLTREYSEEDMLTYNNLIKKALAESHL